MLSPSRSFVAQTEKTVQSPNIVLSIDGIDPIFGLNEILEKVFIGMDNLFIDGSWRIGGDRAVDNQLAYLDQVRTSFSIKQQMEQDEGSSSSVQSLSISLIDLGGEITRLLSSTADFDILGRSASIKIGYSELAYPEDYADIFNGLITEVSPYMGGLTLVVANPLEKLRGKIFAGIKTKLVGAIDSLQTTITLQDASQILKPNNFLKSFIKIKDEIIEIGSITGNTLSDCTRGALETFPAVAGDGSGLETRYQIFGNTVDLALSVCLSGGDEYYFQDVPNSVSDGRLYFVGDLVRTQNITVKDICNLEGTLDDGTYEITEIGFVDGKTIIALDQTLQDTPTPIGLVQFKSRWNLLPEGSGMLPREVDIERFLEIQARFSSSLFDYALIIAKEVEAKELIEKEIFRPSICYSLQRKGKFSIGFASPPLSSDEIIKIDSSNVVSPEEITISRSINDRYYNQITFRYDYDLLSDEFEQITTAISGTSRSLITKSRKVLEVESRGIFGEQNQTRVFANVKRLLKRYQSGAELINLRTLYGVGLRLELGDIVLVSGEDWPLSNIRTGEVGLKPRLLEVYNKEIDLKTGQINFDLVDTGFSVGARYATISPSSIVSSWTSGFLICESGFQSSVPTRTKWSKLVGSILKIVSGDFQTVRTCELAGFDPSNPNRLNIKSLSGSIDSGWIVSLANYSLQQRDVAKQIHAFLNPSVGVVAYGSQKIEVSASDVDKFFVGSVIVVRNNDYSDITQELTVIDILGNEIEVDQVPSYAVQALDVIELIGFSNDNGSSYRLV
jgi:hypothetical protein